MAAHVQRSSRRLAENDRFKADYRGGRLSVFGRAGALGGIISAFLKLQWQLRFPPRAPDRTPMRAALGEVSRNANSARGVLIFAGGAMLPKRGPSSNEVATPAETKGG
jgi:uncharacterized membrane protein YagU involved in acid resistance